MTAIIRSTGTRLLEALTLCYRRDVGDPVDTTDVTKQGFFEFCSGVKGTGTIDAPDTVPNIHPYPTGYVAEADADRAIALQLMPPRDNFDPQPGSVDYTTYFILVSLIVRPRRAPLELGSISLNDWWRKLITVALRGNGSKVRRLDDPDNPGATLNLETPSVAISALKDPTHKQVALQVLLGYRTSEDATTGELK